MDKEKRSYGLDSITVGDIAVDGGMGTALTELFGNTVKGSAILETTEPTVEDIEEEETDDIIESITTAPAVWSLKFNSYNLGFDVMQAVFGGEVTGTGAAKVWEIGTDTPTVEKSVVVTTKNGKTVSIVRMRITAKLTMNFQKAGLGFLEITGKVLKPTKSGVKAIKMGLVA